MGYIRGWRQIKALQIFIECFLKRNFLCAKRELEIFSGFAKPYGVYTTDMFNEQYAEMVAKSKEHCLLIFLHRILAQHLLVQAV